MYPFQSILISLSSKYRCVYLEVKPPQRPGQTVQNLVKVKSVLTLYNRYLKYHL